MERVTVFSGFWSSYDCRKHYDHIFIFGDNELHRGKKGQSVIRDERNAFGIPTKKYPSYDEKAYYTDKEFSTNKIKIQEAISLIKANLPKYRGIMIPENGLGTGLAKLPEKAPKTYRYMLIQLNELYKYANQVCK